MARIASEGFAERIDTTVGPLSRPAGVQAMLVRYIATLRPCSMCGKRYPGVHEGLLERK